MATSNHADRDELQRQFAYELDRELAMTLVGISGRMLVACLTVTVIAAIGLYALMLCAAAWLH